MKVFKAVYPSLKDEKYLQNAVVSEVIQMAQILARTLYRKIADSVKSELEFQPHHCFLKYLDYLSLAETDRESTQPFIDGHTVYIPLVKIFSFPKVNHLCGTFERLSKLISGKVALSDDGSAVVIDAECVKELEDYQMFPV